MRLDPVSLQLFIAVVEEGSIAGAAQRQRIAPAAVSRRIGDLEASLGTPLLLRRARGVEPTQAGQALLGLARRALAVLDDLPEQLSDYAAGLRGQVRMAATISAITQFLPHDLAAFSRSHPHVRVVLDERDSAATVRAVAENAADLGIYTTFAHGESVLSLPYRKDRLCLLVPRRHACAGRAETSFAEVVDEPFVGLRDGSAINLRLTAEAAALGRPLLFRIQVSAFDALCLMVANGFGIGVVPEGVARLFSATLPICAVRLADPWAQRQLALAVRSVEALPPAARRLIDHLQLGAV